MTTTEYIDKALALLERIAMALDRVIGTAPETPPRPSSDALPTTSMAVSTPDAVPSFTYDEVVAAINKYADGHGHQAAKALLTSFGASYIKQLRPEQYAEVMKAFA